ncbi:DUF4212 domain-containing protein [Caldinitratiruptor microaerophilus]|uniref:Membrane protein n=1 Tax=Caldinitratiruptor microaerophilus TaxID=671077 RepID=A0AA35CP18_9FIRM|nr:DUF4212 domain-containing protein [Caldinitratiruptor microaerophilus]BDG62083.1 membrane protein [Caldinitratiruptor microaerophilus]
MTDNERERLEAHFRENARTVFWILVVWALVSYGAAIIVKFLNQFKILTGFPLGYYMGSQGSLIVFVLLIFYYAWRMDQIDRKYGVEE